MFGNRVGVWAQGNPKPEYFPGVAFSRSPEALNQYLRIQYPEFNTAENENVESDALAVLLEEVHKEHGQKSIVLSHSSGNTRGWLTALKTDKVGGIISFESCSMFPQGQEPPPIPLAAGGSYAYSGRIVTNAEFQRLTKFPILVVFGDFIPSVSQGLDVRGAIQERCRSWAKLINSRGGNATVLSLPTVGVRGNTHYPFADTNVTKVADQVQKWIKKAGLD